MLEWVHKAVGYAFAKDTVTYGLASSADYRLSQIADYICMLELNSLKYANKTPTATDAKFLGFMVAVQEGYSQGGWGEKDVGVRQSTVYGPVGLWGFPKVWRFSFPRDGVSGRMKMHQRCPALVKV